MSHTFDCVNCGTPTGNPKFCSKSCAAQVNNSLHPKRKINLPACKHCGATIASRRTVCDSCNPKNKDWAKITLSDLQDRAKYQISAQIRDIARRIFFQQGPSSKACFACGYSKHVEVCHRKAINSFEPHATIAEVNDPKNLVGLCPNCHWEFDHGLLALQECPY